MGCLALLGVLLGQACIFSDHPAPGLTLTFFGGLAAVLGFVWRRASFPDFRRAWEKILERLGSLQRAFSRMGLKAPEPSPNASPAPAVRRPLPAPVIPEKWRSRMLTVEKKYFLIFAGALFAVSQILLAFHFTFPLVFLMLFSVFLIYLAVRSKEPRLRLGYLGDWIRFLYLGFPGLLLVLIGNLILVNYVCADGPKEHIGLICNTAGILILLALMPKDFADPEQPPYPLNQFPGKALSPAGLAWKIISALLGLGLLYFAVEKGASQSYQPALLLGLTGAAFLMLSFPWQQSLKLKKPQAEVQVFSKNLLRLLVFVLAVYLGYRGQTLLSHEQIYPGLLSFGLAGLALIFAFQEPAGDQADPLREAPLAWPWETLGLILIFAFAIWVRTRLIGSIPYGIECDEAGGIVNSREILTLPQSSWVAHFTGQPAFFLMQLKFFHSLFGIDNFGVKFHAMYYGVLSILAVYFLARTLYGPRVALLCAALMATSRYQIHYSRFGFGNTLLGLLVAMGFYFLIKGLRSRRKTFFVLSGMSFAFAPHIGVSARLVPLICAGILLYLILQQKNFFSRNWRPLLALLLGAWMASGALFILFFKSTDTLMGRVKQVSIYSEDTNAPRDVSKGFLDNVLANLTQFNLHGDYRGRHNGGLSGAPLLNFWPSVLFALGFLFSIYYWKRLSNFMLIIWFFGFMSAALFSIESPQSDRIFSATYTVFLFMGLFLDQARRLLQQTLGKPGVIGGGLIFCLLLVPTAREEYRNYFDTQPAFDSNCTAVAKHIGRLGSRWEHFLMTSIFWSGHPPYRAYTHDLPNRFYYTAFDVMPMYVDTSKDVDYALVLEYENLLPSIQWYYPKGDYFTETHPKYGSMFKAWHVKNSDIQATRGLTAAYWANSSWAGEAALTRKDANLDFQFSSQTWPLPGATGSADWKGTIWIPHPGHYTLYLESTGPAEITIGTSRTLRTSGAKARLSTWLAGGLHGFRARAKIARGGKLRFAWSSGEALENYVIYNSPFNQAFPEQPFPANHCFTYPEPRGLLETFTTSPDWTGQPAYQQVQPAVVMQEGGMPYNLGPQTTVEWKGSLLVEKAGNPHLDLAMNGYGEIEVDGILVFLSGAPPAGYRNPKPLTSGLELAQGRHTLRIRFHPVGGFNVQLFWTPPGEPRAVVPAGVLFPAEE